MEMTGEMMDGGARLRVLRAACPAGCLLCHCSCSLLLDSAQQGALAAPHMCSAVCSPHAAPAATLTLHCLIAACRCAALEDALDFEGLEDETEDVMAQVGWWVGEPIWGGPTPCS